jgi:hypothetical protein
MAKQGANDNVSGSVSILETARVIQKLIRENKIERPRRSIRFLWIDEGCGTIGYIRKHPDLVSRWFANINEDMVGEGLIKNLASFHMKSTPHSLPSFLNDVMSNLIEYVGETNRDNIVHRPSKFINPILSATGSKDPFYYNIEKFTGGSDNTIFVDAGLGIPGIQLIVWPDMWYHTNLDRPDKSDSTQFKRVSVIDTAAALFMADASIQEAFRLGGEVYARGTARIAEEEKRALAALHESIPKELVIQYKEAINIIRHAFDREAKTMKTVLFFAGDDPSYLNYHEKILQSLNVKKQISLDNLKVHYSGLAALHGVDASEPELTSEEIRLSRMIPKRTEKMKGYFDRREFKKALEGKKLPEYNLLRYEDFEIRNFIDNHRSILDIRNAASAEFRPIPLKDVENYIKVLEIGGMITTEKTPK